MFGTASRLCRAGWHSGVFSSGKAHKELFIDDLKSKAVDPHKRIRSITIDYDKVENPSDGGGINVYGYANGNKKYDFMMNLSRDDVDGKEVYSIGVSVFDEPLYKLLDNQSNLDDKRNE